MENPGRPRSAFVWLGLLGLLATVAAVYAPVGGFGFVQLDDPDYVTDNAFVRAGWTADSIRWAVTAFHSGHWHPLTWLSLMADVWWFGVDAGAMHRTNVALHLAGTAVLFSWLRAATGAPWQSLAVTALFALHPLRVESVAWVTARKDVLSGLFAMSALWAYVRYARRGGRRWYALSLLAFGLGMLAKPTLATIPCAMLLLDVCPLRRIDLAASPVVELWRAGVRRALEKLPFLLVAGLVLLRSYAAQSAAGAVVSLDTIGLIERLGHSLWSYFLALSTTAWPVDLAVFYPRHPLEIWQPVAGAVVVGCVSLAAWRSRARHPYLLVGWLWFVGTLLPASGIQTFGGQAMADRYTYLPHIGLFVAVVWTVAEVVRSPRWKWGLGVVAISLCAMGSSRQVRFWENSETLLSHAIAVTRGNYMAHNNLGFVLEAAGRREEAAAHYLEAVKANPTWPEALNNAGLVYAWRGEFAEARRYFEEAVRIRPGYDRAENNLATAFAYQGDFESAIVHYTRALESNPGYVDARFALADSFERLGRRDQALREYELVAEQRPGWEPVQQALNRLR